MISLNVENYCHNCPDFEPKVDKMYGDMKVYEQIVSCVNKERCKHIYNEIMDIVERKKDDGDM